MPGSEMIGPRLTAARRARGWSQAHLADQLTRRSGATTLTRHEISRWERGQRIPSRFWVRWIATVTEEPVGDWEQAAALGRAVRRRMPVPGLLLPDLVPDPDLAGRLGAIVNEPGRIDDPAIEWLSSCLQEHRRAEDSIGAKPLVGLVRAQLDIVARFARQASPHQRDCLIDLAAQYAQFLGWMSVAEGDHAAASIWYGQAGAWAGECGNADMSVTVLSMQAHQAWGLGDGRRCLELAHAALQVAGKISPGNQGMTAQTAARGSALLGDVAQARRDMDKASDLLGRAADPAQTEPGWLYFYDDEWFTRQRGTIELQLGNHVLATELLGAGWSGMPPKYRRDRAWIGGCLAVAYAASGQSEAAVDVAVQIGPDAAAVSRYGLRKLREAAAVLDPVDPTRAAAIREAALQA